MAQAQARQHSLPVVARLLVDHVCPIGPYGGKLHQSAPGLVDGGAGRLDDCRPARQLITN
ncbi:hypothetical protein D8I24_3966 (plasmid) [Cupriavidus necator H850]|uniref:hypothetical protein n=1 Tax=Cupriavidus necator TaxID=106590 RepID=UPI003FA444D7|nr:hypothetical protein D8I24_3966 [Cupriavidus necator H850]